MKGNNKLSAAWRGLDGEHTVNRKSQVIVGSFLTIMFVLLLTACAARVQLAGTAWGVGAFQSNGERIYFTATSERGSSITYTSDPTSA
jgi:hypothetical protein